VDRISTAPAYLIELRKRLNAEREHAKKVKRFALAEQGRTKRKNKRAKKAVKWFESLPES
jgi:hypothetical protein